MFSIYVAEQENRADAYCATLSVYRFNENSGSSAWKFERDLYDKNFVWTETVLTSPAKVNFITSTFTKEEGVAFFQMS